MAENLTSKKPQKNLNLKIPLISDDLVESSVYLVVLLAITFISRGVSPLLLSLFFVYIIIKKLAELAGLKKKSESLANLIIFAFSIGGLLFSGLRFFDFLSLDFGSLRIIWVGALLLILFSIFAFYRKFGNVFKQSNFWLQFLKSRSLVLLLLILGASLQIFSFKTLLDFVGVLIFSGLGLYFAVPKLVLAGGEPDISKETAEEDELDTGVKENDSIKRLGALDNVISVDHFETWFGEEYVVWGAARLVVLDTISQENLYITKIKAKKLLKSLGCQQMVVEIMYKSEEVV